MSTERPSGVAWALSRIGAEVAQRFSRRLQPLGLTPPDAATLRAVAQGEASQRELAERLGIVPSRMVVLLDSLEGRGLVMRTVDGEDRRRRVVTLTSDGREVMRHLRGVATDLDAEIIAGLSSEDLAELQRLLGIMQGHLGLSAEGHPGMR